jgi:hypothetical protein
MTRMRSRNWVVIMGLAVTGCAIDEGSQAPEDLEELGETAQAVTFAITPPNTAKFVPPHIAGDRDFDGDGDGPEIEVFASIEVRNSTQVWATIYMHAKEREPDNTEVEGSQDRRLYTHTAPIRIVSSTFTDASYTDTDHEDDTLFQGTTTLVNRFIVTGDTSGPEAGDLTGVRVQWNPITLEPL